MIVNVRALCGQKQVANAGEWVAAWTGSDPRSGRSIVVHDAYAKEPFSEVVI